MLYKTKAVVLRSQDLQEADKLIVLYSEKTGKIKAVAKGVKKTSSRFGAKLEVFTFLNLILFQKGNSSLEIITSAQIIDSFKEIRQDLRKIAYGSYIAELTESLLVDKEEDRRILSLILRSLHWLRLEADPLLPLAFTLRIISLLGYKHDLSHCLACGKEINGEIGISPVMGGTVCPACDKEALQISMSGLSLLKNLLKSDLKQIRRLSVSPEIIDELESLVFKGYLPCYLSRPLKSVEFLEEFKGEGKCVV